MKYKFKLLKMHCAGCALALQEHLNNIDGVSCEINFVTKVIKLDLSSDAPADMLTIVKTEISNFDHNIEIVDYADEELATKKERRERQIDIVRLSLSVVILLMACFIKIKWLSISLFCVAYLLSGFKVLVSAGKNIIHGKIFDENFLMCLASIGAFVLGEFTEAVCVVLLYGIGQIFEETAVESSRKKIQSLLEIKQPYANLIVNGTEQVVGLEQVAVGSLICIKPGEKVPLDARVVEGTSYLNMSALTGETKEVVVTVGDQLLSGSINGSSALIAKVTKLEKDSTVSKIIELVENATETKSKSEKFISKFSKIYTPTVICLAFIIMLLPPAFSGYSNFSLYAYRALSFLVVSCPCALVISVPLTYYASIGSFARCGIMVKGSNFIETLSKVDTAIFDKTGTLTEGDFEVTELFVCSDKSEEEVLELFAYCESYSNHRIAKSILKYYNESTNKEINTAWINDYTEFPGKGVKASVFMQDVIVGNAKFLKENGVSVFEPNKVGTVLYLAVQGELAGYIVIEDKIKKDAIVAVENLKKLGISDISICTGDEENVAKNIAGKLSINSYYAGLLPKDKVLMVTDKVQSNRMVAFVGDGINDAPSLASSNVGIAMGGLGSDIAVESADVVLMTDEPSKVAVAIKKAKKTHKIVLENIIGSIAIKFAVLGLVGFGLAGMWLAVFADVGVSLLAVLNGLRAMLK